MAERYPRVVESMDATSRSKPYHQMERTDMSRTSNYNETVRANNRRYDKGERGKTLPRGKAAARQYRKSGRD